MTAPLVPDDSAWAAYRAHWQLRADTIYLNHGSFGPPPIAVQEARRGWLKQLDEQPMDFLNRRLEPAWRAARERLARFIGTSAGNLIFVENATVGMNVVADSFPLSAGDEVLLTDQEYGAVKRIWDRACQQAGAESRTVVLPLPFASADETVDAILAAVSPRTRLIVVSHITSPTAVTLPVQTICQRARQLGVAVAIDGPHAVAQLPLDIDALDCDFYAASCHKWLSAPFGSGFLYVAPRQQHLVQPPVLSWGRIPPAEIETWSDEFIWSGTRDPSAYLAIPSAIEFLESVGLDNFRARTHWLAQYVRQKLVDLAGLQPIVPDVHAWYGAMAHVPLPPANQRAPQADVAASAEKDFAMPNLLQWLLWRENGIEVPIIEFNGRRYIRVSCHLYTDTAQLDYLVTSLGQLLRQGN